MQIYNKTEKMIIIRGKEWFDKINGNSYFSAQVEYNGVIHYIPFQYGYGDAYIYEALNKIGFENIREAKEQGFMIVANIEKALLKEVKKFGKN
jgi:hypothetical protein